MRRLLALLPFVALAACAATPNSDDAATADEALVSDEMCATLDYGPRVPDAEYYQFFATADDAAGYMRDVEDLGLLKEQGGPDAKFREITTDPRITKLVGDVYEGMRRVFPRETAGLPTAPPVAIVDTDVMNAYALSRGVRGDTTAPWLFVIHSAMLDTEDDALMGVIAHELGHLVLRNGDQDVRSRIHATYLLETDDDHGIFGAKQAHDAALDGHLTQVLVREKRVGAFPELGIATPFAAYVAELAALFPKNEPACSGVAAAEKALKAARAPFVAVYEDLGAQPQKPSATERAAIDALDTALRGELHTCFTAVPDTTKIFDVLRNKGYSAELVERLMLDAERAADANASLVSGGERILAAESTLRAEAIALRDDPATPYARIRTYDAEEDADDASVRVMRALGRDPIANARLVLDMMNPNAKADCLAAEAAGSPIDFGGNLDAHPADCWRYHHAVALNASLGKCAAVPRATRRPSSGGNATVTPFAPLELAGKAYGRSN